jgi:hypothetical protein
MVNYALDRRRHHIAHYPCVSTINKRIQWPLTRRTKLRKEAARTGLGRQKPAVYRAFAPNADGIIKPIIYKDKSDEAVS